jgi:hypothetical protein
MSTTHVERRASLESLSGTDPQTQLIPAREKRVARARMHLG